MKTLSEFITEISSEVKHSPPPPKVTKHPPRKKSDISTAKEVLSQILVGLKNHNVVRNSRINTKYNNKVVGLYAGDIDRDLPAISEDT